MTSVLTESKEDRIFEIIDRVLKQIFGEDATNLIYQHLERHYSLNTNEISDKIDVFAKGLEDFLSSGAIAIENKILNDIVSAYRSEHTVEPQITEIEEFDFATQIRTVTQNA